MASQAPSVEDQDLNAKNLSSELELVTDWHQLGIKLGLLPAQLRKIEKEHPGDIERWKVEVFDLWLKSTPGASWRHIVTALREMGDVTAAERIELKYVKGGKVENPGNTGNEVCKRHPEIAAGSNRKTFPDSGENGVPGKDSRIPSHTGTFSAQRALKQRVHELEERFVALIDKTRQEVNHSKVGLHSFYTRLTYLAASTGKHQIRYFEGNMEVFLKASNINEVFFRLNFYWDFLNYGLLEHIIEWYGSEELKEEKEEYVADVVSFRKATVLRDFVGVWRREHETIPLHLREMVSEHRGTLMDYTLENLEQFRQKFSVRFSLSMLALMIVKIERGSVVITWLIPSSLVPQLREHLLQSRSILDELQREHRILTLTLDGHKVPLSPQEGVSTFIHGLTSVQKGTPATKVTIGHEGGADLGQPHEKPTTFTQETFGGYDCESVAAIPRALQMECPICHLILREPYLVRCCGKYYCHTCIQRLQADNSPCPTCREHKIQVFPNKHFNHLLKQMAVYCTHREDACHWRGKLGELDQHLNEAHQKETSVSKETLGHEGGTYAQADFDSNQQEMSKAAAFAFKNREVLNWKFAVLLTNVCNRLLEIGVDVKSFQLFVAALFPPGNCIPSSPTNLTEVYDAITHHDLWDSLHYFPLVRIVRTFGAGDPEMEAWIKKYKKDVKAYTTVASIEDFIESDLDTCTDESRVDSAKYDPRYYMPVEWKTDFVDHSLQHLCEVWEIFSDHYLVPDSPPTALLDRVRKGCLLVTWLVPSHLIPQLVRRAKIDTEFFQKHGILKMTVGGKAIYKYEENNVVHPNLFSALEGDCSQLARERIQTTSQAHILAVQH